MKPSTDPCGTPIYVDTHDEVDEPKQTQVAIEQENAAYGYKMQNATYLRFLSYSKWKERKKERKKESKKERNLNFKFYLDL